MSTYWVSPHSLLRPLSPARFHAEWPHSATCVAHCRSSPQIAHSWPRPHCRASSQSTGPASTSILVHLPLSLGVSMPPCVGVSVVDCPLRFGLQQKSARHSLRMRPASTQSQTARLRLGNLLSSTKRSTLEIGKKHILGGCSWAGSVFLLSNL